jgi:hypothetical protein
MTTLVVLALWAILGIIIALIPFAFGDWRRSR